MWRAGLACARRVATVRLPAAQRTAAPLRRHYSNVRRHGAFSPKASAQRLAPGYVVTRHYSTPVRIVLPALSPTMTEGVISKWLVKEGDEVSAGDVIFEMETDKATMEVEASEDGVVAKILVPAGSAKTTVNSVVALMVEPGEDITAVEIPADLGAPAAAAPAPSSAPAAATPASAAAPAPAAATAHTSGSAATLQPLLPSVKILVQHHSLNPAEIPASGPKGHLLKGDVLEFLVTGVKAGAGSSTSTHAATGAADSGEEAADYVDLELTNMRKIIAQRLTESKQQIPHTYASVECNLDAITMLRKALVAKGHKVSVNDFILRAAGRALVEVPGVNAQLQADGSVKRNATVDISVAVATPTGLITPIVTNADAKGVTQISSAIKDLAGRAREGKLKPHEYQGGSFSVSNLGMFGISEFNAVINPPQCAIMAVGSGREVAIPVETSDPFASQYKISTVMTAKVSFDERVVDSETMAQWLTVFKGYMDDPSSMV